METKKHLCQDCGTEIEKTETLCDECKGNYFMCEECCSITYIDELVCVDDNYYCESCYSDNYIECSLCGDSYHNSYVSYSVLTDECYCQDCYSDIHAYCENCDDEYLIDIGCKCNVFIKDYNYKPHPEFLKLDFENTTYLGVELEVEDGNKDVDNCKNVLRDMFEDDEAFYIKNDGSLEYGYEIVSHPATILYHKKFDWRRMLDKMKGNGLVSYDSGRCGLHVHISKNSLINKFDLAKIWLFVNNVSFMKRFSQRTDEQIKDWTKMYPQKRIDKEQIKNNDITNVCDRYESVNITTNTIEIRIFRGTLAFDRFWSSLLFCDALVHFTAEHSVVQFLKQDGKLMSDLFVNYLKRNNRYKFLLDYLVKKNLI